MEYYPLAHIARIFNSSEVDPEKEGGVSPEDMSSYKKLFPWLRTDNLDNVLCNVCSKAFLLAPATVERDEWTCPFYSGYVFYNSENLILILKIHNFSENHLRAEEIIKKYAITNDTDGDLVNLTASNNDTNSTQFDNLKPGLAKWGRFLSKFPWMYIKEHNPGCRICEKAVELSKKLPFTKWSDSNLQEPMRTDKPTKMLTQHHLSKYHKTAEDIVNANANKDRTTIDHIERAISISTDEEKSNEIKPPVSDFEWSKLFEKYNWMCGENGRYYGCTICQKARKIDPSTVPQSNWTENMIPFTDRVWYTYLVKKCYSHNTTLGHVTAETVLQKGLNIEPQDSLNNEVRSTIFMSASNNSVFCNGES